MKINVEQRNLTLLKFNWNCILMGRKKKKKKKLTDDVTNFEGLSGRPELVVHITNGGPSSRVSNLVNLTMANM